MFLFQNKRTSSLIFNGSYLGEKKNFGVLMDLKYIEVIEQIKAVLNLDSPTHHESNLLAKMSTVVSILKNNFEHYYWCGFYLVDPDKPNELVVGPYQGSLACLRIPQGKGVCGEVAISHQAKFVADVRLIKNHIACDANSISEIVIPWVDNHGALIGVLDIDSTEVASFSSLDERYLTDILALINP
jgi:GAF domain-containing protein